MKNISSSVCLIPARSGSKGLRNKNMLYLYEKPMIFYTVDAAIDSGCFRKEDIYVSTDSHIYKEICETKGINVIMRPEELSTDFTTSYEVNEDFLKNFSDDQVFVLLQPTSPLRTAQNIKEAMKLYIDSDAENVVSFSKVDKSPELFTSLDDNNYAVDIVGVDTNYRRQDKKDLFVPNGAIFITSKKKYMQNKSYFTNKTKAYIMPKEESLDVDDREDFVNVIGSILFNYKQRELNSKTMYKQFYIEKNNAIKYNNIILGDSRAVLLQLENYDNLSIGGVTLATVVENLDCILCNNKIKNIVISLGVNDLIAGYDVNIIKDNYNILIQKLVKNNINIYMSTITYTLFRESVSNKDIEELNLYIQDICRVYNIHLIDTNQSLSKNKNLEYKYTTDGLHFNEEGQKIFNNMFKVY